MQIQKPLANRHRIHDMLHEMEISAKAWLDSRRGYPRLKRMFEKRVGYAPDLEAPRTYNEKMQWRKIHDHNPLYPVISDKLRMRDYLQDELGAAAGDMLPELYFASDDPDRIDFGKYPKDMVLKANHASGWNIFLREGEPYDDARLRRELRLWLRRSYGKLKQEWAYQQIPRRVIGEELLTGADGHVPNDMKFTFFRDQFGFILWHHDRFGDFEEYICDAALTPLPWTNAGRKRGEQPPKPVLFDEMHDIARHIAKSFDMIRVDFLFTDTRFVLNELTLYRGSGMRAFEPVEWDRHYGDMWTLPEL